MVRLEKTRLGQTDEREPSQPAPARYAEVPPASRLNADRHETEKAARPCCRLQPGPIPFDPALWLGALTSIGGGYALMSGRRLAFLVDECPADELTGVMAQIVGQPERQEAVKHAIERRQAGAA